MSELTLVIGNKNYSSWSLRAWLLLKQTGIPFKEIKLKLHVEPSDVPKYSPSGKVPVLIDGNIKIWESLAIAEYLAEKFPEKKLWPADANARAFARSVCSEMHAGFIKLRKNMPMDCRVDAPGKGMAEGVQDDINRICAIWNEARTKFGKSGPFLFNHFTIADAMFAPVVIRFKGYHVKTDSVASNYMKTIFSLPAMQEWISAGVAETEVI